MISLEIDLEHIWTTWENSTFLRSNDIIKTSD